MPVVVGLFCLYTRSLLTLKHLDSVSDRECVGALLELRAELMAANARISELELELLRQSQDASGMPFIVGLFCLCIRSLLLTRTSAFSAAMAEKVCAFEKGLCAKDDKLQTALRAAALRETDLRFEGNSRFFPLDTRSLFPVY